MNKNSISKFLILSLLSLFISCGSKPAAEEQSHITRGFATVRVDSGYLALRSAPAYAYENEIAHLYTGDKVQYAGDACGSYVTVYTESGQFGWVNENYLH